MGTYYYKQPRYFDKFKCICGDCPLNCCDAGWTINWSCDEVEHLKSADMPEELRERINDLMTVAPHKMQNNKKIDGCGLCENETVTNEQENLTDEERAKNFGYIIKLCDDGRCPLHNKETGLCDIQRTIGEEHLGNICRIYPRRERLVGNYIIRACTSSCPAVIKLIIKDKRACEFEMLPARDHKSASMCFDTPEQLKKQPYLAFRTEILDFFNELFRTGSQNATFEETVLLGALAAKAMSQASRMGHAYEIPSIAADCKKKLKTKEHIQWARDLESKLDIKFQTINEFITLFSRHSIDTSPLYCDDNKTIFIDNYKKGKELFEKTIPEHDKMFKAIAFNIFLDTFMFVPLHEYNFFEFYAFYTVCLATMQVSAYLAGLKNEGVEDEFILNVAKINRIIAHNAIIAQNIVDAMHKAELMYPPQLACIIKS